MKILSLDLSTKSSGFALFIDKELIKYGIIEAKGKDAITRICKIIPQLENLLKETKPDKIVIEEVRPPHETNLGVKTFKALIYLQAAVAFLIHKRFSSIDIEFVYPSEWRKGCGIQTGRGIKREILKQKDIEFVNMKFNIETKSDDIADAILIGLSILSKEKKVEEMNWE